MPVLGRPNTNLRSMQTKADSPISSAAFVVVTAIPAQYFNKKRGLANGLIFAGSGFGGAANSAIIDVLIRKVGLEWAYRILGLLTLVTGISAGYMMKERTEVPRRQFVEWFVPLPARKPSDGF